MERSPSVAIQAEMGRKYKEDLDLEGKESRKNPTQTRTNNPAKQNIQGKKRSPFAGGQTW